MSGPIHERSITAVDLFCGAGGTTTGLLLAGDELDIAVEMTAINHWNVAIDTHTANHPTVRHLCESLDNLDPRKVVPGRLNVLCASPECTHHSIARGGRPMSDQSRASAWHIIRWAEAKQPDAILIENVREFRDWGPLKRDGRPMKRFKGKTYGAFLQALRSLGYEVQDRILNTADYGDPTTRKRLFIIATRGKTVSWPSPTHVGRWRPAREIIDWGLRGNSIFRRTRPLSQNTIGRIQAGLRKFCGEAFLFHVTHHGKRTPISAHAPLPTITGAKRGEIAIAQPFIVHLRGTSPWHLKESSKSVDDPLPTLTTSGAHLALCEPQVLGQQSCASRGPDLEPFIVKYYGTGQSRPVDVPLDTITSKDRFGLAQPVTSGTGMEFDVLFRMLQPHELAAAMSFPTGYRFSGTRESVVRQIGNAVPVRTAKALCKAILARL